MNKSKNQSTMQTIEPTIPWQQITQGGIIPWAGNADTFFTGDWRSLTPVWQPIICKQCLLCFPVCPDSAIKVNDQGKRVDFDTNHCKGCGVCAKVCPFHAIEMITE